jgi:1-acyl-sn-glycerol-3-phosphate acyltransferase
MGDAEIIPIGTRGKPGRGTGDAKPSSNSRSLATRSATPRRERASRPQQDRQQDREHDREQDQVSVSVPSQGRTASTPPVPPAAQQSGEPVDDHESRPEVPEVASEAAAGAESPQAPEEAALVRAPTTADHRHPTPGIPPLEWLSAFTSASKEVFGANWEPRLAEFLAFLRRRLTGEFTVDDYGFDREITEKFLLAAFRPIARKWFRIEVRGTENIPTEGGALVVSNHSGTVPVDGLMTAVSIHDHTDRFLRPLGADLVFKLPIVGDLARKGGATLACNEDAERMLRGGELVGVWPEGFKGIGKPFSERYKLQRFGRGGFVAAAIRTGVPIIPTSVVGAEEIYPLVGNIPSLARLLGLPYLPITPLFPLLGPLGLVPLPSKWLIEFGEPIRTDEYDAGAADDPMLVFNVTDQVRESIQQTLYSLLMKRKSVFS